MSDLFLGPLLPFTISLSLLAGLLALELLFLLIGGSLLGAGADTDLPDLDAPDVGDLDIDLGLDAADVDVGDLELPELDDLGELDAPATGGLSAVFGFGKMPFLIWLASLLMAFGVSGLALQSLVQGTLGAYLPAWLAAIPAGAGALWFTLKFGALFSRFLPRLETESVSERHLGRRKGTVTQGTAARGRPAEIRVTDRHGNTHYLRAEPLRDGIEISQGAEVLVLRHKIEGGYFIVPLSD